MPTWWPSATPTKVPPPATAWRPPCTTGKTAARIIARDWIGQLYQEVWPIAKANGISCFLSPLQEILREGNEAQRWQRQVEEGQSIRQVVTQAIQAVQVYEDTLARDLCEPWAA
jgi:predicted glutamate--cysteine ligase